MVECDKHCGLNRFPQILSNKLQQDCELIQDGLVAVNFLMLWHMHTLTEKERKNIKKKNKEKKIKKIKNPSIFFSLQCPKHATLGACTMHAVDKRPKTARQKGFHLYLDNMLQVFN